MSTTTAHHPLLDDDHGAQRAGIAAPSSAQAHDTRVGMILLWAGPALVFLFALLWR